MPMRAHSIQGDLPCLFGRISFCMCGLSLERSKGGRWGSGSGVVSVVVCLNGVAFFRFICLSNSAHLASDLASCSFRSFSSGLSLGLCCSTESRGASVFLNARLECLAGLYSPGGNFAVSMLVINLIASCNRLVRKKRRIDFLSLAHRPLCLSFNSSSMTSTSFGDRKA